MKNTIFVFSLVFAAACDRDKSEESTDETAASSETSSTEATTGSDCTPSDSPSEECIDLLVAECANLASEDCASHAGGAACLWALELTGVDTCTESAGACVAVHYPGEGGPGPRWFDADDRVYALQCDTDACQQAVPSVYEMQPCDAVDVFPATCTCQ